MADDMFLQFIGATDDFLECETDPFAAVAQELVDLFVSLHRPLSPDAAEILARTVPAVGRSVEDNI
ncbi:hypothetical protein ACFL2E_12080, partial [Thermodesulfobacteriota bacterium]